jgi:methionyl aminopeptidase
MVILKNKQAIEKMATAGKQLALLFQDLELFIKPGLNTMEIDSWIASQLKVRSLTSMMKGYRGYQYVSCISINDAVVHGVPQKNTYLEEGDLVKVDVCASWKDYCADMARCYVVGSSTPLKQRLKEVAYTALDKGIAQARVGNRLSDISAAVQEEVERHGFGVVRVFAGHGIGKRMHEDPEILNYGEPGKGLILRAGMTIAIEPMITAGDYEVYIDRDGWTAKTKDKSLAAHVEDTIAITEQAPRVLTRI